LKYKFKFVLLFFKINEFASQVRNFYSFVNHCVKFERIDMGKLKSVSRFWAILASVEHFIILSH